MIPTILVGLVTLSVLVLIHELGHYTFAKMSGVWVEEFGLGFPPRLYGKKIGETIYSINWIPFGGFNKLSGEVDPNAPRSLASQSHIVRLLVMSGGILFNLLLPIILLSVAFMVPHDVMKGQVEVLEINPDSPAEMAGILPGDIILAVDGKPLNHTGELSRAIQINMGTEMDITLRHLDGTEETVSAVPRWRPPEGDGSLGTLSTTINGEIYPESLPFWEAIPTGVVNLWETMILYKNGIIGMIIGTIPFVPAGPVAIVQITGEVASVGISPLLELAAFISIAIGITQIIPFPALDGGRIFFVLLEWVRRGKRV
ncbi:MAG: M50 family metallopeptidase, partial [Dehalococcoidales bacterium]|nr:M50 family metallopeptidase [Dehalococcoidales bacterium]